MPLSPRDIKSQNFKHAFRGYKVSEVDFFIEHIAQGVDDLRRDNDRLNLEIERCRQRIQQYADQTAAVKETLDLATEKANSIIKSTNIHAQEIVAQAHSEAEQTLRAYKEEFNRRKQILYEFVEVAAAYKRKFHRMIEKQIRLMEDFENSFESRRGLTHVADMAPEEHIHEPVSETAWAQSSRFFRRRI